MGIETSMRKDYGKISFDGETWYVPKKDLKRIMNVLLDYQAKYYDEPEEEE